MIRPAGRRAAVHALEEHGFEARPIAGGQSLIPMMGIRLARPSVLVDLTALPEPELRTIEVDTVGARVGALVPHAVVRRSPALQASCWRAVAQAAGQVGHDAIQTRGTFGGSIAHADPSAELVVVACAYDAVAEIESSVGVRREAVEDLIVGPYQTTLAAGELITALHLPAPGVGARSAFAEVAARPGDFALASVAAVVATDGPRLSYARIAIGGGPRPRRCREAERMLEGGTATPSDVLAAAAAAAETIADGADSGVRRHVLQALVRRVIVSLTGGPTR